jgi:Tfp pilus assembly protein PilO
MKQPDPGNFSPWRIYAVGALVCAALSAGAYAVGVRPAVRRHAEQVAHQTDLRARKQKAANLAGQLNTARTQLAAVNETLRNRTLRLQPAELVNDRIGALTALADAAHLTLDDLRPGTASETADYKTVPILIAGSGTYPDCAAFLHKLRKSFPDMAVRSFETTNNSASPDAPAATFQFDLIWHASKG